MIDASDRHIETIHSPLKVGSERLVLFMNSRYLFFMLTRLGGVASDFSTSFQRVLRTLSWLDYSRVVQVFPTLRWKQSYVQEIEI